MATWSERGLAAVLAAQAALANADGTVSESSYPRWLVLQYRRNILGIRVRRATSAPRFDGGRKPGNPPRVRSADHKRAWQDDLDLRRLLGAS